MLLRRRPLALAGIFGILLVLCVVNTPLREELGGIPLLSLPRGHFYGSLLGAVHLGNGCMASLTMGGIMLSVISARLASMNPDKRLIWGLAGSLTMLAAALLLHRVFIVSKLGETPTWTFYTFAIALALYFTLSRLTELGYTRWFVVIKPAEPPLSRHI